MIIKEKLDKQPDEVKKRWNYNINRVYVVCILNYEMDKLHPDKYRWDVVRMDRDLKIPFSETLNEIYLEMPKFRLELSGALDASYEDGEEKGIEKGIEKGKKEGLAEGMAKGIEKGVMEGVCKTARNFKALGISLTDIVKATGLPLETVQSL